MDKVDKSLLGADLVAARRALRESTDEMINATYEVGWTLSDPYFRALVEIAGEASRASEKFAPFNSPHQGWAVIREELDELWEHVRANTGADSAARVEAVQIAAMALRYAADLADYEVRRDG